MNQQSIFSKRNIKLFIVWCVLAVLSLAIFISVLFLLNAHLVDGNVYIPVPETIANADGTTTTVIRRDWQGSVAFTFMQIVQSYFSKDGLQMVWNNGAGDVVFTVNNTNLLSVSFVLQIVSIAFCIISVLVSLIFFFTKKKAPSLTLAIGLIGAMIAFLSVLINFVGQTDLAGTFVSGPTGVTSGTYGVYFSQTWVCHVWNVLLLLGVVSLVGQSAMAVEVLRTEE